MSQAKKTGEETNGGSAARLPMDIKHIKNLIELMVENDLSRMELREGESHILLRRGQPPVAVTPQMVHTMAANPGPAAVAATPAPVAADNEILIRSPMVGTFYLAADPESPPFVNIGTLIEPNTVVCLIEAMKVFNELKAEVSGRITKILAKNAQAIEFDQPLFAVAPA